MRFQLSLRLGLLFLLVRVHGNGIRAPDAENDAVAERVLEAGKNETQEQDPSDWFGEGGGDEPAKNEPSKNETTTEPAPTEPAPSSSAETDAPANGGAAETENLSSNSTSGQKPTPTTEAPAAEKTESPAGATAATTPPVEKEPTNPPGTEVPSGDDDFGDDYGEGEVEGEGEEWGFEPEVQESKAPYVPPTGDDPFAKEPDESAWTGEDWKQETPEEMMHDKNVITVVVASSVLFGFVLALCSAQQVIENPDGCCASLCRCCVKVFCFFFKILCFPCRMCCGNKDRRSHDLMIGSSDSYTHDLELT